MALVLLPVTITLLCFGMANAALGTTCLPIVDFLRFQYDHHVMFLRRGVPNTAVSIYFCSIIKYLKAVLKQNRSGDVTLGDVCLTDMEVEILSKFVSLNSIDAYVVELIKTTPNLFFLPQSQFKDEDLLPFSRKQNDNIERRWRRKLDELSSSIRHANTKKICSLPRTVRLFYDPKRKQALEAFSAQAKDLQNVIQGSRLLDITLAIVVRLELLHVGRTESAQILIHCAANIFNSIRATRLEGDDVLVSNIFVGLYQTRFKELTAHLPNIWIPEIPLEYIAEYISPRVRRLTLFSGWGQISYLRKGRNRKVRVKHIQDMIFAQKALGPLLAELLPNQKFKRAETGFWIPDIRRDLTCGFGFWYYNDGPNPSAQCCSYLCKSLTPSILMAGFSILDCCKGCNIARCPTTSSCPSVRRAATIEMVMFGLYGRESIRIIL